jgi:hypothetical protein
MHAHNMHAHNMHAHNMHAIRCTPIKGLTRDHPFANTP